MRVGVHGVNAIVVAIPAIVLAAPLELIAIACRRGAAARADVQVL